MTPTEQITYLLDATQHLIDAITGMYSRIEALEARVDKIDRANKMVPTIRKYRRVGSAGRVA